VRDPTPEGKSRGRQRPCVATTQEIREVRCKKAPFFMSLDEVLPFADKSFFDEASASLDEQDAQKSSCMPLPRAKGHPGEEGASMKSKASALEDVFDLVQLPREDGPAL